MPLCHRLVDVVPRGNGANMPVFRNDARLVLEKSPIAFWHNRLKTHTFKQKIREKELDRRQLSVAQNDYGITAKLKKKRKIKKKHRKTKKKEVHPANTTANRTR